MVDGPLSVIVLLGAGFVLLRPKDVPIVARNIGRIVGLTVRGLRQAKNFADDVIQRSTKESANNPNIAAMRTQVQSSLDQFSDLASTVRRDMSDVPLSPASFIRSKFRSATFLSQQQQQQQRRQQQQEQHNRPLPVKDKGINSRFGQTPLENLSVIPSDSSKTTASPSRGPGTKISKLESFSPQSATRTGADFVARSLEEAALASQYRKLFPSENDQG